MYKQFHSAFLKLNIDTKATIYVAVSGGIDSMALSNLLSHFKIEHVLLHCNFQLRGLESDEDEAFIRSYALKNSIAFKAISFDTNTISKKENLTTQECARNLRYNWFRSFLETKKSVLLTAHHLDDSIETFFINLLRGTGVKGLAGIPNGDNNIFRPLLPFTKEDIKKYVEKNNITFREDSSNNSDNYLRNKLRHHFVPEFKKLTSNFDSKISTLFTELKNTNKFIEQYLSTSIVNLKASNQIKISDLNTIPQFMWYKLFSDFGLSRLHNDELIKLSTSHTGSIFKSSTHVLLKDRDNIIISSNQVSEKISVVINDFSQDIELENGKLTFKLIPHSESINFNGSSAYLDFEKIKWPITLRNWKNGDKICPFGLKGNKLISKILIDKKINRFEKESQYIIESNGEILWLLNLVVSNNFSITNQTKKIIKIEYTQY